MLINAQAQEELRIAILQDETLENFQIEAAERGLTRGNIYRGVVTSIHQGLSAAFVDYGVGRDGFLSVQDVVPEASHRDPKKKGRARIDELLERGRTVIVQVVKDPEGQKGAALTTNISLAGRYLVFTPFDSTRGVSRKVEDEEIRKVLKEQAARLSVPEGAGFIVRTNAIEQTKTSLNRDFAALMRVWKKIGTESKKRKSAEILYDDQDLIVRVMRDYFDASIDEVLIDDDEALAKASDYVGGFMPKARNKLIRYTDRAPLFSRHDIETQIERIYDRTVPLPGGGSIVIDRTEALVAIDVNSGRARAGNVEQTALQTNLEAADAVGVQLRLRDLGGLIVIDFIDMRSAKARADVEKRLRDAMKGDKARSTVGKLSPNGLLEVNRQKIQQALALRTHRPCPTCQGTGRIASPEMVSVALLRKIETRAAGGRLKRVRIALHPELADAFQNSRRQDLAALEREFGFRVEVIAASHLHRPEQEIEWIESDTEIAAPVVKMEKARPEKQKKPAGRSETAKPDTPTKTVDPEKSSDPEKTAAVAGPAKRSRRRRRGKKAVTDTDAGSSVLVTAREDVLGGGGLHESAEEPESATSEGATQSDAPEALVDGAPAKRRRRRGKRRGRKDGEAIASTAEMALGSIESVWLHDDEALESVGAVPVESISDRPETEELTTGETAASASGTPAVKRRRRTRRRGRKPRETDAAPDSDSGPDSDPIPF